MNIELKKRIITSILLFLLVIFCVFINKTIYLTSLLLVSTLSVVEIFKISNLAQMNNSSKKWNLIKILSFFYFFGIFIPVTYDLINLGSTFVIYILLICIFSDIGGYIVGKIIGGKKLTKISPKKTVSGSVGSFCFSLFPLAIFYNFNFIEYSYSLNNLLLCLAVSLVCQSGDLFISYLKRDARVKDTGNILPGHGGLLDRIDGIIFGVPFVWFYINDFKIYLNIWNNIIFNL
jgi:phosphatidate cytidylyltransferase